VPLQHRRPERAALGRANFSFILFSRESYEAPQRNFKFGERSVLKLMYAAVTRAAECWRGITVGEYEQRQLKAIRAS